MSFFRLAGKVVWSSSDRPDLSDHAPLRVVLTRSSSLAARSRPLPPWIASHPEFKKRLHSILEEDFDFHKASPSQQLVRYKAAMVAASNYVRQKLLLLTM